MNKLKRQTGRSVVMVLSAGALISVSAIVVWANDAGRPAAAVPVRAEEPPMPEPAPTRVATAYPTSDTTTAAVMSDSPAIDAAAAYYIGDRLKIAFFEKVDSDEAGTAPQSQLVERVELSGEYVVQDDGNIFLPLFGAVPIVGQNPRQLEDRLAALFKSNLGRNGIASIVLSDREPIYIVGTITKAGTHKYTPGMTVMHAIALSDGLDTAYADFSRASESIRERERRDKSARQIQLLLARQAALAGERDGREAEVPERLVEIVGIDKARALVATYTNERRLALAAREAQRKSLQATMASAGREIGLLRTRLTHVEESIKNRSERLDLVTGLRAKGTFNDHTLFQVRGELSDVLEREDTVKSTLAQTEEKLAQARHDITKLDAESQMGLYRELNALESEIADEDLVLLSSERLIRAAGSATQALPATPQDLHFTIARRTSNGLKRFTADAMTALQAGDLLEITRKPLTQTVGQRVETH